MAEPTIICPNCKSEIELTESLAAPIVEQMRERFRKHLDQEKAKLQEREKDLQEQHEVIARERRSMEEQIRTRLATERGKIVEEEAQKAKLVLKTDLEEKSAAIAALQEALTERDGKLADSQKAQAELLRKQRALEDEKRELDLTIERRVQESLELVRDKAKKEAEGELQLRVREREEQISSMQRQIEELKRRAEQGSQQLQGEVYELELEEVLRREFPLDLIEPVGKGEFGGDLVQRVSGSGGAPAGSILWEVKRTKAWSDGWLTKLRTDQRAANADLALIVSQTLPKGLDSFDLRDGVWVTGPHCALPVAIALRQLLISTAAARKSGEGQLTKMELVYEYLTGPRFRHRVEAIVEQFNEMRDDLEKERKVIQRQWAKREQQIRCVVDATAGMYGDLQGIAGKSIQEVEGLSMALLDAPDSEDS